MSRLAHPRGVAVALVLAVLVLLPVISTVTGNGFLLVISTRIVIMAIAAVSLNSCSAMAAWCSATPPTSASAATRSHPGARRHLFGGAVSVAILASGAFALVVGMLCLRTRGVYFIMVTLAFAQMAYYVATGLDAFGGDDGLTIYRRSQFGLVDLSNKVTFYYLCIALLAASVGLVWRLASSRFGLVVQGSRSNDKRMHALGFPTYRYRLVCFIIAGMLCGLAGALLANHSDFISPATMHWTRSGDLLVMVILGGMRSLFGPVFGAIALLTLEEGLSEITEYWQIILGPLFLAVVLYARGGIDGLLEGLSAKRLPLGRENPAHVESLAGARHA